MKREQPELASELPVIAFLRFLNLGECAFSSLSEKNAVP
jgi:hypothetical protein